MKILSKHTFFIGFLLLCTTLAACKKDNYLTDGGVHNANTPYSTYDYLAGNQYHYFDTVIHIIDHFGLKDSVNKSGTFFAPTDYAVNRLMNSMGILTLDSLYTVVSSKLITQYLFTDKTITLDNATTTVKIYPNWADSIAGIKKTAYTYGSVNTTFTYYILQYVKINGVPDGTGQGNDPTDYVLSCQTTGILTNTGTTLHVLSNASSLSAK